MSDWPESQVRLYRILPNTPFEKLLLFFFARRTSEVRETDVRPLISNSKTRLHPRNNLLTVQKEEEKRKYVFGRRYLYGTGGQHKRGIHYEVQCLRTGIG